MKGWRKHKFSVLWATVIAVLTLIPAPEIPDTPFLNIPHFDKIVHFFLFGILAFLLMQEFLEKKIRNGKSRVSIALSFLIPLIYSALIEFFQIYIPGRGADLYDLLANFAGIISGVVTFLALRDYMVKRNENKH
jgi:VanZ family protein